ncbi:hypothetical protein CCR96_06535 [Halochromatium roseum]|nr:hypothetical protein [Halochromatium roseum]
MSMQPHERHSLLAAAWHALIDTEQRPAKLRLNGLLGALPLLLCLLTGCAIDGAQDVRFVTDPVGGSDSTSNVSWTEVVGIERGLPGGRAY